MKQMLMSQLAIQIRGVSYKPDDLHKGLDENSIALLRANNIDDGEINFNDLVYVDRSKVSNNQLLRQGDILICASSGSKNLVGKAAQVDFNREITFGAFCKVVRPTTVESDYLGMYFQSPIYRKIVSSLAQGANINNIKNADIDNLLVNIPNNDTQKKIVEIFKKMQSIIRNRQQQLQKLDELIKARFFELYYSSELGAETTVGEITKRVKVGFVGTCEKYYTDNSGIPMLRTGNITEEGIDLKDLKYVTREFHDKNIKSQIHAGDLLIARHGSNGQANVYSGIEAQCLNAIIIVPNQAVASSRFLAELINSPEMKKQIEKTLVGSTQRVVNTKSIANLKVKIPSLKVQNCYENFARQVDKSKAPIQQSLNESQLLLDNLMQKYFKKGELA